MTHVGIRRGTPLLGVRREALLRPAFPPTRLSLVGSSGAFGARPGGGATWPGAPRRRLPGRAEIPLTSALLCVRTYISPGAGSGTAARAVEGCTGVHLTALEFTSHFIDT